jgi:hypothetical protein
LRDENEEKKSLNSIETNRKMAFELDVSYRHRSMAFNLIKIN